MDEVEAFACLIAKGYVIEDNSLTLQAFETDSWNFYKDGKYVAGTPDTAPSGAEHYALLVLIQRKPRPTDDDEYEEFAFKTAKEAAEFFVKKKNEI